MKTNRPTTQPNRPQRHPTRPAETTRRPEAEKPPITESQPYADFFALCLYPGMTAPDEGPAAA